MIDIVQPCYNPPMSGLPVPAARARVEISVLNSRFIASAAPAFSAAEARVFVAEIREEFADARHHVPAFLIGHGNAVTAHCHDDGEPSGTAGRPVLAAIQGSGLGDIVVVVTRYFGGTKLGTGGLVRAYGDAARAILAALPRAHKVITERLAVTVPYSLLEPTRRLVARHAGVLLNEEFAAAVSLAFRLRRERSAAFRAGFQDLTQGSIEVMVLQAAETTIMPPDPAS